MDSVTDGSEKEREDERQRIAYDFNRLVGYTACNYIHAER